MGQSQNSQTLTIVNYYILQNQIQQYLTKTALEDKKDQFLIKKGYLLNPDWVKQWKILINYDNLKFLLNEFKIKSINFVDEQELLVNEFITKPTESIDIRSINHFSEILKFEDTFISLETLENLMNQESYNKGMKGQQVKYIFKKEMLILLFDATRIIKIVYFYDKENKLINLKFVFKNMREYNRKVIFFKDSNFRQVIEYLDNVGIWKSKSYNNYDTDLKKVTFQILYEEEVKNNNLSRTKSFYEKNNTPGLLNNKENKDIKDKKENKKEQKDDICRVLREKSIAIKDLNELINREKIFSITIITPDQNYISITGKYNMPFNNIENQLLKYYPDAKNSNLIFTANGKNIDRNLTFEENNIKAGDKIIIVKNEEEKENDNVITKK